MELDKKKYSQKEVSLIFDAYKREYEKRFTDLRLRINELIKENERLKEELALADGKEELTLAVLRRAEQTAMELEKQSKLEYELALAELKSFSEKWKNYFDELMAKYPASKNIKKAVKVNSTVNQAPKTASAKKIIKDIDALIEQDKKVHPVFEPKKKIGDYIAATSDSGFNMEEVLNPGELKLEDICKELGLIDSNE